MTAAHLINPNELILRQNNKYSLYCSKIIPFCVSFSTDLQCRISLPRFSSPQCLVKRELSRQIKKTLIRLTSPDDNRYSK